ncbi:hypothetical protein AA106555_0689 [Neokomagataea thailandica NBRC 106555]|uniref:Uncharacterized protein n=2 Tax=Neokomagataea TaxID=1223423 RepID=A0A4Y6V6N0_9PROT|nr:MULTISPECIES: hypothetical protein [Neokomagataea]QDH24518.1 hypothetical protein D5366_03885 [Neokomagataea tanensis]GBR51796.1 hypothetical protein AA106555_0689 [Neokomagataea thailandica NBRC 106555]
MGIKAQTASCSANSKAGKSCCKGLGGAMRYAGRGREVAMTGLTFMASFGPKRFRPHCQQILAVISVAVAAVEFFKNRRKG